MLLRFWTCFTCCKPYRPTPSDLDIGVPARGWTGEAYQGHVFWDELFIFPFFQLSNAKNNPIASDVPLPPPGEARAAAMAGRIQGSDVPLAERERWSGGDPGAQPEPRSQRWVPDNSYLQRHVGSAIAHTFGNTSRSLHDIEFLHSYWCGADPRYRLLLVEYLRPSMTAQGATRSARDGSRRVSRWLT